MREPDHKIIVPNLLILRFINCKVSYISRFSGVNEHSIISINDAEAENNTVGELLWWKMPQMSWILLLPRSTTTAASCESSHKTRSTTTSRSRCGCWCRSRCSWYTHLYWALNIQAQKSTARNKSIRSYYRPVSGTLGKLSLCCGAKI